MRYITLKAVEARFDDIHAETPIKMLSDNGSAYAARETRTFAGRLGLKPCFKPVRNR